MNWWAFPTIKEGSMRFLAMALGAMIVATAAPQLARAGCSSCDGQYFCDDDGGSQKKCQIQQAVTKTTITCPNGSQWTVQGGLNGPLPTVNVGQTVQPCSTSTETQNFCRYIAS